MPHALRPHAGFGETVIEPCGGPVAKIRADRQMNRREYLQQNEYDSGEDIRRIAYHATANAGSALSKIGKNCHSLRARKRFSMVRVL